MIKIDVINEIYNECLLKKDEQDEIGMPKCEFAPVPARDIRYLVEDNLILFNAYQLRKHKIEIRDYLFEIFKSQENNEIFYADYKLLLDKDNYTEDEKINILQKLIALGYSCGYIKVEGNKLTFNAASGNSCRPGLPPSRYHIFIDNTKAYNSEKNIRNYKIDLLTKIEKSIYTINEILDLYEVKAEINPNNPYQLDFYDKSGDLIDSKDYGKNINADNIDIPINLKTDFKDLNSNNITFCIDDDKHLYQKYNDDLSIDIVKYNYMIKIIFIKDGITKTLVMSDGYINISEDNSNNVGHNISSLHYEENRNMRNRFSFHKGRSKSNITFEDNEMLEASISNSDEVIKVLIYEPEYRKYIKDTLVLLEEYIPGIKEYLTKKYPQFKEYLYISEGLDIIIKKPYQKNRKNN